MGRIAQARPVRFLVGVVVAAITLSGAGSARAAAAPPWSWPVPGPHVVLRRFEAPATPYAAGHRGVDLDTAPGAAVRAPADGVVSFAGRVVDRGVIAIDHAGVRSSFEPVNPRVRTGDAVRAGDVLGVLAAGGAHPAGVLHVGARVPAAGGWAYVDPLLFLGGSRNAVLLPLDAFDGR